MKSYLPSLVKGAVFGGLAVYLLKRMPRSNQDSSERSLASECSPDQLPCDLGAKIDSEQRTIPSNGQPAGITDVTKTRSTWWGIAFAVAVPILLTLLLGLAYRLRKPGGDFLAFSANVAQLLALLSLVGLQVSSVRDAVSKTNPRTAILAWLGILILTALSLIVPPRVALYLNTLGSHAMEQGRLSIALQDFQAATSLDPKNARAHYNLGNAYQQLQAFDEAIAEYHHAIKLDDQIAAVYNNLGQLYLATGRSPDQALTLLLTGLAHSNNDLERGILTKNVGWAYLERGLTTAALDELNRAETSLQELENRGYTVTLPLAETSRLIALTHEASGQDGKAKVRWLDSKGYAQAIVESPGCANAVGQTAADCVQAELWLAEADDKLAELLERE